MKPTYVSLLDFREKCLLCENGPHPREFYVEMYEGPYAKESVDFKGCLCIECIFKIEKELDTQGWVPRRRFNTREVLFDSYTEIPMQLPGPWIQKLKHVLEKNLFPGAESYAFFGV